jgi:hypothetical protein
MFQIEIQILKIIDNSFYPGWVECLLVDAWGNNHTFHEKIPIVTVQDLDTTNMFPQDGNIRCELLREWIDDNGRIIITVSTEKPDYVETINEVSEFDLLPYQVTEFCTL